MQTVPGKIRHGCELHADWLDWPGTRTNGVCGGAIVNGAVAVACETKFGLGEAAASSTIVTECSSRAGSCRLENVYGNYAIRVERQLSAPQYFACVKSPGFGPASAMLEMCSVPVPEFVSVNPCEAPAPPTIAEGKREAAGNERDGGRWNHAFAAQHNDLRASSGIVCNVQ